MKFESYSQVGQDRWVYETLVIGKGITDGKFLDVGCNHPFSVSNSFALERIGWTGILMDNDFVACDLCRKNRKSLVIETDTTLFDFSTLPTKEFDYLSLDVDSATLDTLRRILDGQISFKIATIEHDSYRFGPGARDSMRVLLEAHGYYAAFKDVKGDDGVSEFEDWWVKNGLL